MIMINGRTLRCEVDLPRMGRSWQWSAVCKPCGWTSDEAFPKLSAASKAGVAHVVEVANATAAERTS